MLRLKKLLLLIFVALCIESSVLSPQIRSVNNVWNFKFDYSKTQVSIAPNNDYNKFVYAICDHVEQNRTKIDCTVTVESNIFSDAPDKKVCDLKIRSEDGYYIKKDSHKVDMLDSDKVIIQLEEVLILKTDERFVLFERPSIVKVRTVDMSSCRSTGSDVVVKINQVSSILPSYYVRPIDGTLKIVAKLNQTPCNGSYCILTYDSFGEEIGKPTPVIPHDNLEQGVLINLVPSSKNHIALFVGSVDNTSVRAYYVEPYNNVLRPVVLKDKNLNKEIQYNFGFSNGHARLLVCYQNSTIIDCKQLDERFNLKMNVVFPRGNEKVKQVLNLKEGASLLLTDGYDMEDMQLWKIDEHGRRLIALFEKLKCVDTERLYEGENEFCLISTCKHLDTTHEGFKYRISSRCVDKNLIE